MNNIKIATLATAYNRSMSTLCALESLHNQIIESHIKLKHYIVDDNSTDDTEIKILNTFPNVQIFKSQGGLYWAGGMRFGFDLIKNTEFDFLLVYNDDCKFQNDAVQKLLDCYLQNKNEGSTDFVTVGAFISEISSMQTYGGRVKKYNFLPLSSVLAPISDMPTEVHTLNMNLALIPKLIIDQIGFLADYFQHGGADWEYGIRLNKSGFKVYQAPGFVGYCEINPPVGTSHEIGISCFERMKRLISIKESPVSTRYKFSRQHGGFFWLISFFAPFLKIFYLCFKSRFKSAA